VLVRDRIAELVTAAVRHAHAAGELPPFEVPAIEIGRPKDPKHGDYSSTVALQAARLAKMAPLAIAQTLARHLPASELIAAVEVLPPGFINFRFNDQWLASLVARIEADGAAFGSVDLGHGRTCQVEFISANPTGQLHIGSARNAVLGDSLGNLLAAAGWQVQREYYVNDAGTQMRTFAETLYRRYKQAHWLDAPLEKEHYQGEYIIDLAKQIQGQYGDRFLQMNEEEAISALSTIGRQSVMAWIRASVERLGIQFYCWFSEKSLYED